VVYVLLSIWFLLRSLLDGLTDPAFRGLSVTALVLLITGTIFWNRIEGWSLVDSFYFSVITLATVGFGDFTPETTFGKLFTAFYVMSGVGVIVAFINALGERREARRARRSADTSEA
jgi:voltage-gated potassium channel